MSTKRRDYGSGSIYQRCDTARGCPPLVEGPPHPHTGKPTKVRPDHVCKGLWVGALEAGWNANGTRRRPPVYGKSRRDVVVKLRKRREDQERGALVAGASDRTTIKQWVEKYLELRKVPPKPLSPNGWNAAASPLRKWAIPTIGHKRLATLTPADRRAVAQAQYDAGRKTSTADATDRALQTCLNRAVQEGYMVPPAVLAMSGPGMGVSDRLDVRLDHALACLAVASQMPHGIRWALTLLYGTRQGEMLGLVETDPVDGSPCVDFDQHVIRLAWQLQQLRYLDRKNKTLGFDVPRDYEAVHLIDSFHLVRPKSKKGTRVLPMIPATEDALRLWLAIRPANPWGLVFPTSRGRPCNDKVDREEWRAIQYTASVEDVGVGEYAAPREPRVFHPAGRYWHGHECRNLAATELDRTGASDNVITSLLGHAGILTSRGYMTAHLDAKRTAIEQVAERLGLSSPDSA